MGIERILNECTAKGVPRLPTFVQIARYVQQTKVRYTFLPYINLESALKSQKSVFLVVIIYNLTSFFLDKSKIILVIIENQSSKMTLK
jgi:hypothetical protein